MKAINREDCPRWKTEDGTNFKSVNGNQRETITGHQPEHPKYTKMSTDKWTTIITIIITRNKDRDVLKVIRSFIMLWFNVSLLHLCH